MNKISDNYLNDSAEDIDPQLVTELDQLYFNTLPNIHEVHPKLLVVFSGGNAMGKTTISERIRDDLNGLMLENDAIKRTLKEIKPEIERDELNRTTWQYSMNVYQRLPEMTSNGLVVRDGVIDWYFDRILPVFEVQGFETFVIGFSLSKEKNEEIIRKRGDTATVSTEFLLGRMAEHHIHMKRFREKYQLDIELTDENLFDHDLVINTIAERLKKMC